jgi:hypothetical protein
MDSAWAKRFSFTVESVGAVPKAKILKHFTSESPRMDSRKRTVGAKRPEGCSTPIHEIDLQPHLWLPVIYEEIVIASFSTRPTQCVPFAQPSSNDRSTSAHIRRPARKRTPPIWAPHRWLGAACRFPTELHRAPSLASPLPTPLWSPPPSPLHRAQCQHPLVFWLLDCSVCLVLLVSDHKHPWSGQHSWHKGVLHCFWIIYQES